MFRLPLNVLILSVLLLLGHSWHTGMSGFICGCVYCIFYLGIWSPNYIKMYVHCLLFMLWSIKSVFYFFLSTFRRWLRILRSTFGTSNMEITGLKWFLLRFVCLLNSFQLRQQNSISQNFCSLCVVGLAC